MDNKAEGTENQWRIPQWFADLDLSVLEVLKNFYLELLKANKNTNLIPINTVANLDEIHFADSILASNLIMQSAKPDEVFDFGSGSGFPGIVMAILNSKTRFILVESDLKKADFLIETIQMMNLKNIQVIKDHVEKLPANSVKFGVSRGFSTITKSLLSTRKVLTKGGVYFHLKNDSWSKEVAAIPSQLCTYWQPEFVGEYRLPVSRAKNSVVKTTKIED